MVTEPVATGEASTSLAHSMSVLDLGGGETAKREHSKERRPHAKKTRRSPPNKYARSTILSRSLTTASAKFLHVKEHYAILGHLSTLQRTTRATAILHEIRDDYCKKFANQAIARWYKSALTEYHKRIKEEFPNEWDKDRETILIYCSETAAEKCWINCKEANEFGFPEDTTARYREAAFPAAIIAFFEHKDSCILQDEDFVVQFREEFTKMQKSIFKPPSEKLGVVESFLGGVCERYLALANGEPSSTQVMAQVMVSNLDIVPTLESQW